MEVGMGLDFSSFLGQVGLGLPVGLGAIGSALGVLAAGSAAAGAWGKSAKAGKPQSFLYVILSAAPLSQTIYGFIFMFVGLNSLVIGPKAVTMAHSGTIFGLGLACGIAELFSAWGQGKIGAAACRALSEGDDKGFGLMLMLLGIIETVGIFGFLFPLLLVMSFGG